MRGTPINRSFGKIIQSPQFVWGALIIRSFGAYRIFGGASELYEAALLSC